ncbi:MAG: SDR family oxidoreductase [Thermoplasmata archaeon]|nr:SDR family oxidoreductase [Thermoplasmata archaeon]
MSAKASVLDGSILVVGGTGDLGGRAVRALLARGKKVRALVRPGSDPSGLVTQGVEVVRGDMLDPASLAPAMAGVSAVVSTAIGYSRRRETDSLRTDTEGNRNLVDAARKSDVPRFVFQSILTCDQAESVPHFWPKKLTEDYLQGQGVPFVSLRPGAYLGGPWMKKGLEYGGVMGMTPPDVRITFIDPDEVARALALSVDEPRALGKKIDLGSDRPLSSPELAELLGRLMGRKLQLQPLPQGSADMTAMAEYFATGKYVADTRVQGELFPPVPKIEETARKMLKEFGLLAP